MKKAALCLWVALMATAVYATQQLNAPWGLQRIDQRANPSFNGVYNYTATGHNTYVVVLDTGVGATADNDNVSSTQFNFINGQNGAQGADSDCSGHGTMVAGIIASQTYGVAKSTTIVPAQAFDCDGNANLADVVSAFNWIATHINHPAVINASFSQEKMWDTNGDLAAAIQS